MPRNRLKLHAPAEDVLSAAEAFALPFYAQPHRAYHNAQHVRAVLHALASRGVLTPALALAVWGHDLIYDPQAPDNEGRSAEVFGGWLAAQGAEAELVQEVTALILATRHTSPPRTRAEAVLVDADLSILGADVDTFAAYDAAIRQEYVFVPEADYRAGRARVLRGFLEREQLYVTPEFAALEGQARANLTAALAQLELARLE
ncbi:putative HD phosphohydrolase family protein [Deinococcus phoenicis]|uniref:Putative HD phosphohydrolase family protein n=1 Tax=Deinococcus phoenicis TaxID=1476583 RepID=A0A016QU30_9DEIO|nr:phosphohydrolase [Deinococcus phoenicis]EYB69615.1 putative HD phosphohydrolase family protein [Deinococcus phoenicis]